MATPVTMPRLGLTMAEGTVVEWHVPPGGPVERGAVVLTIESEKAQVEVEAVASGTLAAVYVEPGATVPVGTLLGAIAAPGEPFDPAAFAAAFVPEVAPAREATSATPRPAASSPEGGPAVRAAPAARALARRVGIELAAVAGTGPGGRITVEDVERAAASLAPVEGGRLSYAVTGDGVPLLFINGFGVDATGWRPQVDALRDRYRVVTYDHRGIGASSPIGVDGITIAELAEDAHRLIAHLELAPAVVIGASMGAAIALELAIAHAEDVRALILLTPVFAPDARFDAVLASWRQHEDPTSDARIRALLPWLLGRETLGHAGRREAFAAALRAMAARTPADALRRHANALAGWLGTRSDLSGLRIPALIVGGSDDILTPPFHGEALARALPDARLEVISGEGHAAAVERADAFNALVRDFVDVLAR